MMTQEQTAITRLKQGDISGLAVLVELHQTEARQAAFLITRNHALAEDLVQAAFVRAYERIDQFDAARPFRPWFMRSVINDARLALTRRKTSSLDQSDEEGQSGKDLLVSPDPGLYETLEALQTKEAVWSALEKLTDEQRVAVVMHYYLDISSAEISRRLQVPPGTIRRRLHDARQNLRRLLPSWIRPTNEQDTAP